MSKAAKVTKAAAVPGVAAKAAKDATSSVVTIAVVVLLAIFVVIPLLPSIGEQTVKATGRAALDGADRLGDAACWPTAPICPPANANRTYGPRAMTPPAEPNPPEPKATTAWTTPPTNVPYGEPNGKIKPLPSQLPPPEPASPSGNLPTLGNPNPGGGLLGKLVPGVEGAVKALGPGGLKAIGK